MGMLFGTLIFFTSSGCSLPVAFCVARSAGSSALSWDVHFSRRRQNRFKLRHYQESVVPYPGRSLLPGDRLAAVPAAKMIAPPFRRPAPAADFSVAIFVFPASSCDQPVVNG